MRTSRVGHALNYTFYRAKTLCLLRHYEGTLYTKSYVLFSPNILTKYSCLFLSLCFSSIYAKSHISSSCPPKTKSRILKFPIQKPIDQAGNLNRPRLLLKDIQSKCTAITESIKTCIVRFPKMPRNHSLSGFPGKLFASKFRAT